MSYEYLKEKPTLFTEDWQRQFLQVRDTVHSHLMNSGAVRMDKAIKGLTGSVWTMMACVDRLVELGEIREITNGDCAGQYRIFVSAKD